jgi:hypothetical protein
METTSAADSRASKGCWAARSGAAKAGIIGLTVLVLVGAAVGGYFIYKATHSDSSGAPLPYVRPPVKVRAHA